jgi:transketolase
VHPTKLKAIAKRLRIEILKMANRSKGPHVGSCLSCIDILAHLYFNQLKIDSGIQGRQERDYFILSKGHGAMALYATLVEKDTCKMKAPCLLILTGLVLTALRFLPGP